MLDVLHHQVVAEDLQIQDGEESVCLKFLGNAVFLDEGFEGLGDLADKDDGDLPVQGVLEVSVAEVDLVAEQRGFRKRTLEEFHRYVPNQGDELGGEDEQDLLLVDELVQQPLPWLLVPGGVYDLGVVQRVFEMQGYDVPSGRSLDSDQSVIGHLLLVSDDMGSAVL